MLVSIKNNSPLHLINETTTDIVTMKWNYEHKTKIRQALNKYMYLSSTVFMNCVLQNDALLHQTSLLDHMVSLIIQQLLKLIPTQCLHTVWLLCEIVYRPLPNLMTVAKYTSGQLCVITNFYKDHRSCLNWCHLSERYHQVTRQTQNKQCLSIKYMSLKWIYKIAPKFLIMQIYYAH